MTKKNQPGCPCCGSTLCITFYDKYDVDISKWDERAGTWSINSDTPSRLETSSSNALIITNAPTTAATDHWIKVHIESATSGDEIRLIVGYEDDDNYCYIQLEFYLDHAHITYWERIAGRDTQQGDEVLDDFSDVASGVYSVCYDWADGKIKLNTEQYGSDIFLEGSTRRSFMWLVSPTAPSGTKAGLGTGTISGAVKFGGTDRTDIAVDNTGEYFMYGLVGGSTSGPCLRCVASAIHYDTFLRIARRDRVLYRCFGKRRRLESRQRAAGLRLCRYDSEPAPGRPNQPHRHQRHQYPAQLRRRRWKRLEVSADLQLQGQRQLSLG